MLIHSHRLKSVDYDLWESLAEIDLLHNVSRRENEAIDALKLFLLQDKNCYVGTSWGKDSMVIVHLLYRIDVTIPLMHLRPSNHNPDCDAVRDAYFELFSGQEYEEVIVDYCEVNRIALTDSEMDKATDKIWYQCIRRYGKPFNHRHILGIRAEESTGRNFRMMRWGLNSPNASAPIGRWSTTDVFAYLAKYDLPIHPAYAMLGGGRWQRDRLRVAEIGDIHGRGGGRDEWEKEYYGDVLRRSEKASN